MLRHCGLRVVFMVSYGGNVDGGDGEAEATLTFGLGS